MARTVSPARPLSLRSRSLFSLSNSLSLRVSVGMWSWCLVLEKTGAKRSAQTRGIGEPNQSSYNESSTLASGLLHILQSVDLDIYIECKKELWGCLPTCPLVMRERKAPNRNQYIKGSGRCPLSKLPSSPCACIRLLYSKQVYFKHTSGEAKTARLDNIITYIELRGPSLCHCVLQQLLSTATDVFGASKKKKYERVKPMPAVKIYDQ